MQPETIIALVSVALATIIAVVVPWVTFRLAISQDQLRETRQLRAQLYVDLLTEAYAERQYVDYETADDETRERMRAHFVDMRLPQLERARLGARGTIFANQTVNKAFNRLESRALLATLSPRRDPAAIHAARLHIAVAHEELEAAIRADVGTDFLPTLPRRRRGPGSSNA